MVVTKRSVVMILGTCLLGFLLAVVTVMTGIHRNWPESQARPRETARAYREEVNVADGRSSGESAAASDEIGEEAQNGSVNVRELKRLQEELDLVPDIGLTMDMQWDSRNVSATFSDPNRITDLIKTLPTKGLTISSDRLDGLHTVLTRTVLAYGNSDLEAYFDLLRESGETVAADIYEAFRQDLRSAGRTDQEVPTEPWEVLSEWCSENKERSLWGGFVVEGSEIRLFQTRARQLDQPGEFLKDIRKCTVNYRHLTTPPISPAEMLRSKGAILMAEVTVFIAHADEVGSKIRPYIIRYWFDSVHEQWRPSAMSFFPNRLENLEKKVDLVFYDRTR